MTGSFNSKEQSRNDPDYYNISLEMHRIWGNRNDGYWLYVEQAVATAKDKPYRQRIYHIFEEDGVLKSVIYSLPDEKKFIGGWEDISVFNTLSPEQLETRKGCEVIIKRKDEEIFMLNQKIEQLKMSIGSLELEVKKTQNPKSLKEIFSRSFGKRRK